MSITRARKRSREHLIFRWKIILKFILFFLFLSVFLGAMNKLKQFHYFPIKEVKVYGAFHTDHATIQSVIAPLVGEGFFGVDIELIKDRLQQAPWVNKVFVQRVWPEQVLITLDEKVPVARWKKSTLLSTSGELFTPAQSSIPDHLPEFIGPDGEQIHMLLYYKKMSDLFSSLNLKVTRLEWLSSQSWNLTFDNGVKVSVEHKDVLTRLGHFVKVYPKIVGTRANDVDYVDLRYPNGLAVKWKTIS